MQKAKFKFLFFMAALLVSNNMVCMRGVTPWEDQEGEVGWYPDEPGPSTGRGYLNRIQQDNSDEDEDAKQITYDECPICMTDDSPIHMLKCGHGACTECLRETIKNAFLQNQLEQLRCSDTRCKKAFTEQDYTRMMPFAKTEIERVKGKIVGETASASRPITPPDVGWRTKLWLYFNAAECPQCNVQIVRSEGCHHMTCKSPGCRSEFCWFCNGDWNHNKPQSGYQYHAACPINHRTKTAGKAMAATVLVGAGIYALSKNKKVQAVTKKTLNWISEKYKNIKAKVSPIISKINIKPEVLVSAVVGGALFAGLQKNSVDLATPIHQYLGANGGMTYWQIRNIFENLKLIRIVQNKVGSSTLINGGLSISGGLLAGYMYKLLNNNDYKPRNKPRPLSSLKPKTK